MRNNNAKEAAKVPISHRYANDSIFLRVTGYAVDSDHPGSLGTAGGNADSSCEQRPNQGAAA